MTEKEKMLRGMLYAPAHDETLLAELAACKAQCQQFNQRAYQAEGIESAQMLLRRWRANRRFCGGCWGRRGSTSASQRPSGATTAGISVWAGTST